MDDSKIVELYLSRNESAISQTAQKYGLKLRRIADSILNNMASAEECENDTYLEAWNRIPPNEPRTYLFAFLGKITRHLAIDECRKVEEAFAADELALSINAFLATCSEDQRNIFVRRYWYFDTVAEISKKYGYSQSKVKTALFRMREGLKQHLEKEGYAV